MQNEGDNFVTYHEMQSTSIYVVFIEVIIISTVYQRRMLILSRLTVLITGGDVKVRPPPQFRFFFSILHRRIFRPVDYLVSYFSEKAKLTRQPGFCFLFLTSIECLYFQARKKVSFKFTCFFYPSFIRQYCSTIKFFHETEH